MTLGPTKKNLVKIEPEIPILQIHYYTLLGTESPLRGLPRSPPKPLPPIKLTLGPTKKNLVKIEPEIPILQTHYYTLLGIESPLRGLPMSPPNLSPQLS